MLTEFDPEKNLSVPVYGPPPGGDPGSRKWGFAAKIWFVLMILGQWIVFIEYATKPAAANDSAYRHAAIIYGIAGAVGTVVYLWLIIGKKKAPLYIILAFGIINAILTLVGGGSVISALTCLIAPGITYAVAHNNVS